MLKVPQGFTDLLPEKAEVFYFVKEKLISLFQNYGFLPLVTPSIELIDTFKISGEDEANTFNFIDHVEAKTACFRYDFTPQVARVIANQKYSLPVKLCYDGVVLRNPKRLSGENREIYQAGVEIIGDDTFLADLELVILANAVFKTAGISDYKIFLSDVGILKSLFYEKKGYMPVSEELKQAFIEKNISEIAKLASRTNLPKEKQEFLKELPLLCGDIQMVAELEKKCKIQELKPFFKKLKNVAIQAEQMGVVVEFDLGEVRGFEYHSGLILDCYAADSFKNYHEVITGGRYDNLLQRYLGRDVAATGFAVDLLKLSLTVSYSKPTKLLVLYSDVDRSIEAFKTAEQFRQLGITTVLMQNDKFEDVRMSGEFNYILTIDKNGVKVIDTKRNSEKIVENLNTDFANKFLKDMIK